MADPTRHPAPYPDAVLAAMRPLLPAAGPILDPFAGIGRLDRLATPERQITAVEIEPEWAGQCEANGCAEVLCKSSASLPAEWAGRFAAVATSPAYGNRLADSYAPNMGDPKHRQRRTYRIALGRDLAGDNGGGMHWTPDSDRPCEYRTLHALVWREAVRCLAPGGTFLLNCKDHVRDGIPQGVTAWHVGVLCNLGLLLDEWVKVPLRGDQNTATMRKLGIMVVDFEWVVRLRKPQGKEAPRG